jgi:hypothetical protein
MRRDKGFYLVTGGGIGLTESGCKMETVGINVGEFHIG